MPEPPTHHGLGYMRVHVPNLAGLSVHVVSGVGMHGGMVMGVGSVMHAALEVSDMLGLGHPNGGFGMHSCDPLPISFPAAAKLGQFLQSSSLQDISLTQQFTTCESRGLAYQVSCIPDIYITIHNDSKVTVMKQQQNNFMVGKGGSPQHEELH